METDKLKFMQPKYGSRLGPTPHLYVANCGPNLGSSVETIATAFGIFGSVATVHAADETGTRMIVTYHDTAAAQAAKEAWDGCSCSCLGNRVLHIRYSVPCTLPKVEQTLLVFTLDSEMSIPGLYLIHNFVTEHEEHDLLTAVDERPWQGLLKRRVQHYGYEFMYKTRNVDREQCLGQLPVFLTDILNRISSLPEVNQAKNSLPLDQLTVNEYPPGVGLSPHIDTHSAFDGCILSLSLAGPCVMEFRKYTSEGWSSLKKIDVHYEQLNSDTCKMLEDGEKQHSFKTSPVFDRKAIFLPPRSLLVLSEEARYAWHHYIPHHKVDIVNGERIPRSLRRVSFTFRKVRFGSCSCRFPQYCDSQIEDIDSNYSRTCDGGN